MIPQTVIDEILTRVSIVDVIGNYFEVTRAGKNHTSLCPFHSDKNPSLSISEEKGLYHCFSCGASGNTVKFLMEYKKIEFPDAMDELARMAGIDLDKYRDSEDYASTKEKERLYKMNQDAMQYYHDVLLKDPQSQKARDYIKNRKLSKDSVENFRLGYGGMDWQGLLDTLKKKGYTEAEIEKASLASRGKQGYYDRFRDRIIFPIFDVQSRVVGFGGRILEKDAKGAKYLNSSETAVFHKSQLLFGLDRAKELMTKARLALVVEGYMDVIALHQNGIVNSVAALGTAFGESHLRLLKRYCDRVVFIFDADAAGLAAANRAVDLGVNLELKQGIVILPPGSDPDDYSMQHGGEAFLKYIEEKFLHPLQFKLRYFARQVDPQKETVAFLKRIFPWVQSMKSAVRREDALRDIAAFIERDLTVVQEEYQLHNKPGSLRREEVQPAIKTAAAPPQRMDPVERELMALLVVFPEKAGTVSNIIDVSMLKHKESQTLFEFVVSNTDSNTPEVFNRIGDEALKKRASDLANRPDLNSFTVMEVAYKLKILYFKSEMEKNNRLIAQLEAQKKTREKNDLLKQNQGILQLKTETERLLKEIQEKMI